MALKKRPAHEVILAKLEAVDGMSRPEYQDRIGVFCELIAEIEVPPEAMPEVMRRMLALAEGHGDSPTAYDVALAKLRKVEF